MTDNARRVCCGGWGSDRDPEFLIDIESAETRSQPTMKISGAWGKRELGVSALWGDLLLGWPTPRKAMLDLSQGDVNEFHWPPEQDP